MSKILAAFQKAGVREFADIRAFCEAAPYCLRVTEKGSLYALRYNRGLSDFRLPVVREARGIVFEKSTNSIVSRAFDKFYEYGENAPSYRDRPNLRQSVSNPQARYERKYDGVLIKVVKLDSNKLLVSTNGKIDAADAPLHGPGEIYMHSQDDGDLVDGSNSSSMGKSIRHTFAEAGGLDLPYQEGHCYAFELRHPELATVIPAVDRTLVHLATRQLSGNFEELPIETRFNADGVSPPEVVTFRAFSECREAARLLPWDDEGFVVSDGSTRVKVKSEAYMAMQRLLAKDSECEDSDGLTVALTLHRSSRPIPVALHQLVDEAKARLDALAEFCLSRALDPAAIAACRGRSARGAQAALETYLGGRLPRRIRAVLASSLRETSLGEVSSVHSACALLDALRRSQLSISEMTRALRLVEA